MISTNILRNPSFEEGTDKGYTDELNIPNEWGFWHATRDYKNPHDPADHARFQCPHVSVLFSTDLPEHERDLFILDGDHTLKIAQGSGSWYGRFCQNQTYIAGTLTMLVNIFGDLVKAYDGKTKIWADDAAGRDGLFRFNIDGQLTDWQTIIPGQWNTYIHDFALAEHSINLLYQIGVEIMCPYPLKNSGIFADAWTLTHRTQPPIPTEEQAVEAFRHAWRELFPNVLVFPNVLEQRR